MVAHLSKSTFLAAVLSGGFVTASTQDPPAELPSSRLDRVLENVPVGILKSRAKRQQQLKKIMLPKEAFGSIIQRSVTWTPGSVVRVAFLGGDAALHKEIEQATAELTDNCSVALSFRDKATGSYRTWSRNDKRYAAELRLAFDHEGGYWSLIGQECIRPSTGEPGDPWGGRPNQSTMNLEGFDVGLNPEELQRTVRHEFMHALGFHHEHQHPDGTCEADFRWENDSGYVPTTVGNAPIPHKGKNPGVYTYMLALNPTWKREDVDHNLRPLAADKVEATTRLDAASIMLYRYPPFLYLRSNSPCRAEGKGEHLSGGDKAALKNLYPSDLVAANKVVFEQQKLFERIELSAKVSPAVKAEFRNKAVMRAQ